MEFGSGSNKMKVQNKKRKSRRNKLEFLGWGSKPLIEFLDSIGKESRQYSQGEVDAIKKKENHVVVDDDAQDNAPPLFSLRLTLRFFQSVKGEVITRAWVAQILPGWERAIHVPG
nr:uncharacterized protein At5g08430-like [Ipomoea trifida]